MDGDLIPIIKGLYEDNPKVEPSYLAPWIYGPSYLSFDYALYFYDIIPETVYTYTSATFNKRKRKEYRNYFGVYTYRDVPKAVYHHGVTAKTDGNYSYHIATARKQYVISSIRLLQSGTGKNSDIYCLRISE